MRHFVKKRKSQFFDRSWIGKSKIQAGGIKRFFFFSEALVCPNERVRKLFPRGEVLEEKGS